MNKAIKFRNNIYLDSSSIVHTRKQLSNLLEIKNIDLSLINQSNYSIPYPQYSEGSQILDHVTYFCFFLHVDNKPSTDVKILNVPPPRGHPHWQFSCWETANDTNTPLVIRIENDGSLYARNGVRGMNYFIQISYINQ